MPRPAVAPPPSPLDVSERPAWAPTRGRRCRYREGGLVSRRGRQPQQTDVRAEHGVLFLLSITRESLPSSPPTASPSILSPVYRRIAATPVMSFQFTVPTSASGCPPTRLPARPVLPPATRLHLCFSSPPLEHTVFSQTCVLNSLP